MIDKASPSPKPLKSPVLFLIFNRPDTTRRVFEAIRQAQPSQLFIAADGARDTKEGEDKKCREVRKIVDKGVDWDCQVHRLYREKNLGCKIAVSSAIDWFFEHVEEGIILEDDCLPHTAFFRYCEELLMRYQDDKRIMHISGCNFIEYTHKGQESYFFSKYCSVWGWATWRRAWKTYDVNIEKWPEIRAKGLHRLFLENGEIRVRQAQWDSIRSGFNTWDYQWTFAMLINNSLSIAPKKNLISNIGFGRNATHTTRKRSRIANYPDQPIEFPLVHPRIIVANKDYDKKRRKQLVMRSIFLRRIFRRVKKFIA